MGDVLVTVRKPGSVDISVKVLASSFLELHTGIT